ncbi:hypothetical protein BGZ63DRAFT_82841 [Mariannaea sp. PMI_226]|nr:hypothetical protein BGZ63DRAFT_82841 [Mariannaea sp. PMI_226]
MVSLRSTVLRVVLLLRRIWGLSSVVVALARGRCAVTLLPGRWRGVVGLGRMRGIVRLGSTLIAALGRGVVVVALVLGRVLLLEVQTRSAICQTDSSAIANLPAEDSPAGRSPVGHSHAAAEVAAGRSLAAGCSLVVGDSLAAGRSRPVDHSWSTEAAAGCTRRLRRCSNLAMTC